MAATKHGSGVWSSGWVLAQCVGLGVLAVGCGSGGAETGDSDAPGFGPSSTSARPPADYARRLRDEYRFRPIESALPRGARLPGAQGHGSLAQSSAATRTAVIQAARIVGVRPAGEMLEPEFAPEVAGNLRSRVALPVDARDAFHVEDIASGVSMGVALQAAQSARAEFTEGLVVYQNVLGAGTGVLHRVTEDGTEDFVEFETPPAAPEVRYSVQLGPEVAGLRLVSNTLELLDAQGVPRLRVSPPYLVDSKGELTWATLELEDCEADTSPLPTLTPPSILPGKGACSVLISWDPEGMTYPVLLDPQWVDTGNLAIPRYAHAASTKLPSANHNNNSVIVTGGIFGGTVLSSVEILYEPPTGSPVWSTASSMTTPRAFHVGINRSETGTFTGFDSYLVAGGYTTGFVPTDTAQRFTFTNFPIAGTWSSVPNMSSARGGAAIAAVDNQKALIVGGVGSSGAPVSSAQIYDFQSNTWLPAPNAPRARAFHTATSLRTNGVIGGQNSVLVAGGFDANSIPIAACDRYVPAANLWGSAGTLSPAVVYHTATQLTAGSLANDVLVAGGAGLAGFSWGVAHVVQKYRPSSNTWVNAFANIPATHAHTATLLANGQHVVWAGGYPSVEGEVPTAVTSWYTGPITQFNMLSPRAFHVATLLRSGAVFVAGGANNGEGITGAERALP